MRGTTLGDLDAVVAIMRRGSFRAAAADLGISTTALSNAIGKLETDLGVRLFNRTTRSVSLTDAGLTFVSKTGPALEEIHAAMDIARSQQAVPSGVLRINAFATAARYILPTLILPFVRQHPQVHIDLVTEGRQADIVADGFDLGVRVVGLVPTDMIAVPVGPPMAFAVVATPAYFEQHPMPQSPADLAAHRCLRVRLPNGAIYKWRFEKDGHQIEIDVDGPLTLDEPYLVQAALQGGAGLGFMIEADVRDDIAAGRLIRVLEDWTPPRLAVCIYYSSRRNQSAALKAFIAQARALPSGPAG